jgi:hypothetical protein
LPFMHSVLPRYCDPPLWWNATEDQPSHRGTHLIP